MASGIGIKRMIHATHSYARGRKAGHWSTQCAVTSQESLLCSLHHYGTKMLEWHFQPDKHPRVVMTGWWVGYGSASDQGGVNAALDALGLPQHYYRDARGGGPRVNPGASYRVSASVGRAASSIRAITPPDY